MEKSFGYVLYSFIDQEKTSTLGDDKPSLFLKRKALNCLLVYALKKYFKIDAVNPIAELKNGMGCYEGIYFSIALCYEAICVAVSDAPINVEVAIRYGGNENEFAKYNLSKEEYAEYQKNEYGADTFSYIWCKKRAIHQKESSEFKEFLEDNYTSHRDFFLEENYFFLVTGVAEFIKVNIETIFGHLKK